MMNEAKQNPNMAGNEVPHALQVALAFSRAAEGAGAALRRQHQLIQQLKGEIQHLRDINHNLAEQLCQKTQAPVPAPEEPEGCSISIATEGKVPPEVMAMLEALVNMLNSIK